jgi:hypothetical protein
MNTENVALNKSLFQQYKNVMNLVTSISYLLQKCGKGTDDGTISLCW